MEYQQGFGDAVNRDDIDHDLAVGEHAAVLVDWRRRIRVNTKCCMSSTPHHKQAGLGPAQENLRQCLAADSQCPVYAL